MDEGVLGSMTPQQYIDERVKQYQNWYNGKAVKAKSMYLNMRTISVIAGAIVPVMVNLEIPYKQPITTFLSLIVVILVSLESVRSYRELWHNYRSTEQLLGREMFFYLTKEGLYRDMAEKDAYPLFVERIENAISAENTATLSTLALGGDQSLEKKRTNSLSN